MTNLKKMSVQRLINLDNGLSTLFYLAMSGVENGGPDVFQPQARQLTDLLDHQTDIQKVLHQKVKDLIDPFDYENDNYDEEDTV